MLSKIGRETVGKKSRPPREGDGRFMTRNQTDQRFRLFAVPSMESLVWMERELNS